MSSELAVELPSCRCCAAIGERSQGTQGMHDDTKRKAVTGRGTVSPVFSSIRVTSSSESISTSHNAYGLKRDIDFGT